MEAEVDLVSVEREPATKRWLKRPTGGPEMIEIVYGVVQIEDHWMVISHGLRMGPYTSRSEAEEVARRMARQASGMEVKLHLQDELGELHQERQRG